MNDIRTKNFTGRDVFNAATAKALKDVVGQTLIVTDIWITERVDNDGIAQVVANIKTSDGEIYATISNSVIRSAEAIPELLEEGPVSINVEERPSKNGGRDYLVITLA